MRARAEPRLAQIEPDGGCAVNKFRALVAGLVLASSSLVSAAPLFPDVPDNHWAKDAVAALAAKGLVEGYPDGTFKGDRAATRWEVAMIVARLLAKMEQEHATFATKAELEELRKLVNALREELDALGVRVTNLEENVSRLDKRVSELERITFYGSIDARAVAQSFRNTGRVDNSNGFPLAGATNYATAVGTLGGATLNPLAVGGPGFAPFQGSGALPVVDLRNGRALTNGAGFTMRALLGLRIRVSDDIDAGAEFSAFTSQGDAVVDAIWGNSAPFLSNPYNANTVGPVAFAQGLSNTPFTRMNLDNFWVLHNPSSTKLILGSFSTTHMDSSLFTGTYNPNAYGPTYLDNYGFDVSGRVSVSDAGVLTWEALGTRLGDGNISFVTGTNYQNYALGANLGFEFEGGNVKVNFLRAANEASNGGALLTGLTENVNFSPGASIGWTPLQWVNPPGFYLGQVTAAGPATTADGRPIPGWNAGLDNAAGLLFAGGGSFGPQGMTSYGISADYAWDVNDDAQIYFDGTYAHSEYKPNRNSTFSRGGNAGRFEIGANLLEGDLDLSVAYLTVDPTYDPFILQYPTIGGLFPGVMRLPSLNYFTNLYSLHDTEVFPHNREGVQVQGLYRFDERRGLVSAHYGNLNQKVTSLYDVRIPAGALGGGIPNSPVLGFSPGFIDPVFPGFADPSVYGPTSASSFTAGLAPLENPRGNVESFGLAFSYRIDDPNIKVDTAVDRYNYTRNTSLPTALGGSQNRVNLQITSGHFGLEWEPSQAWTLRGGADVVRIAGHYDPAGIYNRSSPTAVFNTVDTTQVIPFIGFDNDITANTQWGMNLRYYLNNDHLTSPPTSAGPVGSNLGFTAHPFSWEGFQLGTEFKVRF